MKYLAIFLIFLNFAFANYNYKDENSGKIDMHGGKKASLIDSKNSLNSKDINQIGIVKPTLPKTPQNLIKDDEKSKKESKK